MGKFRLQGSCVWLTGASSGIGEYLAIELAKRGARVALTARRAEVLAELVARIKANGGSAESFPGDVTSLEQMKQVVREIEARLGPVDLAIPNAGTHIPTKPEEFNSQEYIDLMTINYGGMLRTIEAVLPGMLARRKGYVAPVASLAGVRGLPKAAAYGASKAAMNHFLESIRFHLKRHDIAITVINPGFVKTPLTDKNDFHMPLLVSSEYAARVICEGLEKQKREIAFPPTMNLIVKCGRLLPAPLYELIVDRLW